jgi:nucleoside-diphosphate-sugar epimerase
VSRECGDRVVIARITAVMGPGSRSWLGLFRAAASGTMRLVGDGSNNHHPADVSDIVDGLIRCALTSGVGGKIFNLAGPQPLPIAELRAILSAAARENFAPSVKYPRPYPAGLLALYYHAGSNADRVFGLKLPLIESLTFLTADRILDLTRARTSLGYQPSVAVKEAAERTASWLRRENLLPRFPDNR